MSFESAVPLKRSIGFDVRMEEEEDTTGKEGSQSHLGGPSIGAAKVEPEEQQALLTQLAGEREKIIQGNYSTSEKLKLLDDNRKAMVIAKGGRIAKSENVVYGILLFGGVLVIVLAILTVLAGLPPEVILSFVGTVLGGTIATIAQKLGKL